MYKAQCQSTLQVPLTCRSSVGLCSFFCCLCWLERHHIILLATYLRRGKCSVEARNDNMDRSLQAVPKSIDNLRTLRTL